MDEESSVIEAREGPQSSSKLEEEEDRQPWAPHPMLQLDELPKIARIQDSGCHSIEDSITADTPGKKRGCVIQPFVTEPLNQCDDACFYNSIDVAHVNSSDRNDSSLQFNKNNISVNKLWTGKSVESSSGNLGSK